MEDTPLVPHLDALELEPAQPATASVIWMHGLGADASDFYSVPPELRLPDDLAVRYVFPNAPKIPVTINMGMIMQAWYDVSSFDRRDQDEHRIRQSATWIDELVAREVERGVPASRIVLAGFSQGGAMALFAGLRHPEALAGVMCLSGYLLLAEETGQVATSTPGMPPIFQAHGTGDPVVSLDLGYESRDVLTRAGFEVEWHEYPMGHQVCLEEIRDVGRWLAGVLVSTPEDRRLKPDRDARRVGGTCLRERRNR